MAASNVGFVSLLSESLGAGEQAIRLLLSLAAGYPLAFAYRSLLYGHSNKTLHHVYFIITGMLLCYFNFGVDTIHSLINIAVIWVLLKICGGTWMAVLSAFVFNTIYLTIGYYRVSTDDYDITWATPHCVLCLKLTGVAFDLYDGRKPQEKLSTEQKETALLTRPSFLELAGHSYFFGAFLVGPQYWKSILVRSEQCGPLSDGEYSPSDLGPHWSQNHNYIAVKSKLRFSIRRYVSFIDGTLCDKQNKGPPLNVSLALGRLFLGVVYIALFQCICAFLLTTEFMLTDTFMDLWFVTKCAYILFWGKLVICKYIGCWLVAEGSCMLTGLTYNGKDINGNSLWNGCTNVKVIQLETSSTFREMIGSFNVNTNNWMARYVFKRAKFLGSKEASQVVTLTYLAVWHGLHSGYYMNFFLEFIMLYGDSQLTDLLARFPRVAQVCSRKPLAPFVWMVKKAWLQFFVSYALLSFVNLKWARYMQVYGTVYYVGHVTFLALPVICVLIKSVLPRPVKSGTNGFHHNSEDVSNGKKQR